MSIGFSMIMFLCIVPTMIICYIQVYPRNWRGKKLVFGVKNRKEFTEGETAEKVDEIVKKYCGIALWITIVSCVISLGLFFMRGLTIQMTVWTGFVLLAIIGINIPYAIGNKEMKTLKRSLGIQGETGVTYVDLTSAGAVHALKPMSIWLPNLVALLPVIVALLTDLKVLQFSTSWVFGTFLVTAVTGTFWLVGMLILVLAFVMDGLKNEVISTDSTTNANYNRAKKKNMADMIVLFCWVNAIFTICSLLSFLYLYNDLLVMISLAAYMVLLLAGVALYVMRQKKIEALYEKEMVLLEDDDDYWIRGLLYYNPKDQRLNVEKRVGVGGTINMAHPIGKVISVFGALALVGAFVCLGWLGMLETTPMQLRVENGKFICHQVWDEYVIDMDDIQSYSFCETLEGLRLARTSGVGMETIQKGNFIVDGKSGCKVFLCRAADCYIKIETKNKTYYVNASTREETWNAFDALARADKKYSKKNICVFVASML
jgi:hypothetical protein